MVGIPPKIGTKPLGTLPPPPPINRVGLPPPPPIPGIPPIPVQPLPGVGGAKSAYGLQTGYGMPQGMQQMTVLPPPPAPKIDLSEPDMEHPAFKKIEGRFDKVWSAYDKSRDLNKFRAVIYKPTTSRTSSSQSGAADSQLVPGQLQLNNFDDLLDLCRQQDEQAKLDERELNALGKEIDRKKTLFNEKGRKDVMEVHAKHVEQQARVLNCMRRMEVLKGEGSLLTRKEEDFQRRLTQLQMELSDPDGFRGQLGDLTVRVQNHVVEDDVAMNDNVVGDDDQEMLSRETRDQAEQILAEHARGIAVLRDIIMQDLRELTVLRDGLQQEFAA